MNSPTISWAQATAIAHGAAGRCYSDPDELAALVVLHDQVRRRGQTAGFCRHHDGDCDECPHRGDCPLGDCE